MLNLNERNIAFSYLDAHIPAVPASIDTRILTMNTVKFVHSVIPNAQTNVYHLFGHLSGLVRNNTHIIDPRKRGKSGIRKK